MADKVSLRPNEPPMFATVDGVRGNWTAKGQSSMRRSTYEAAERRMWRDAFCAVYGNGKLIAPDAGRCADTALIEFRQRYPAPNHEPEDEPESANWNSFKALRRCVGALIDLREAVKGEPAMNASKFDSLGVAVNAAIDAGIAALKAYPEDAPVKSPENPQEPNQGAQGGQDNG